MSHLYLKVIVPLAVLLPLLFGLIVKKNWDATARIIFIYLLVSGVVNEVATVMSQHRINNLPLLHIYTVFEFISFSFFYKKVFDEGRKTNRFLILQISFVILCILNAVFLQSIYSFNSYTLALKALILMLLAVNYFAKLFTNIGETKIIMMPRFWFNSGMFLYFSGSFIFYIFSNFTLYISRHSFDLILYLHAGFVLVMYMLFTIGFIKCKK
ncbi:MAG: hypothetical protein ABJA78_19690 [Ferruginibacter sp.]